MMNQSLRIVLCSLFLLSLIMPAWGEPLTLDCGRLQVQKPKLQLDNKDAEQAYFTLSLHNPDARGYRVVAVYSPVAAQCQIRQSDEESYLWKPEGLAVPANHTVKVDQDKPVVFNELQSQLEPGERTPVVLICADGSHRLVKAVVVIQNQCEGRECGS